MQSLTDSPASEPLLTALAQALFWIEQDLCRAAEALTNVSPLTENGRSPELWMTAGGLPPRVPVNVWIFEPVAAAVLAAAA